MLLLIQFYHPSRHGLWFHVLFNTLHAPVFGIIAICLYRIASIVTPWSFGKRLAAVLAAAVVLGGLSELAQLPTGRDASLEDLLTDVLGASAFLFLALASGLLERTDRRKRVGFAVAGFAALLVVSLPLLTVSAAYLERNLMLPNITAADTRFGDYFWRRQNAVITESTFPPTGQAAFRVQLRSGAWPGMIFNDIWQDWRGYSALLLEFGNGDSSVLTLHLRVHDREHLRQDQAYSDRFNRPIALQPGTQLVRIPIADIQAAPASRQIDLAQIDGMAVFSDASNAGREFYLLNVRLE